MLACDILNLYKFHIYNNLAIIGRGPIGLYNFISSQGQSHNNKRYKKTETNKRTEHLHFLGDELSFRLYINVLENFLEDSTHFDIPIREVAHFDFALQSIGF